MKFFSRTRTVRESNGQNSTSRSLQWAMRLHSLQYVPRHQHFLLTDLRYKFECAIDEWASGLREKINFTEEVYSSIFNGHLEAMQWFYSETANLQILDRLMQQVYENGWFVSLILPIPQYTNEIQCKYWSSTCQ